jgi:GWxTD domain-containing protein
MKLLETWVETPLAAAVGWTVLHSLWEGALIAALLAAALLATRSPRIRYGAACVALLVTLLACCLTFLHLMPEAAQNHRALKTPVPTGWMVPAGADAAGPSNPLLAAIAPWLGPLWIAGVWIFYARHIAGWISVRRLRRRGVCCAPQRWQRELTRLSAQLRLSRPVQLLESCFTDSPIVLGHFRPLILMPMGLLAGLPPGQIEAILLHELAHIRRHDYLANILQRLLEGLLFYHPAIWWMSRVITAERENCCDDVAVATSGDAHQYALALAELEQTRWSAREPAVAATGGNLVKRIRRLLYPGSPNGAWTPLFAAIILIATTAAAVFAWPQQGADSTGASPYDKWLNQDVVYIINDQERAAFARLTTDEERQKFVEQFWLRRDPTPGTAQNEFKEEHYRRIEYANQRFRTASGQPGWQTDRGHMYVVYGPPDELEDHPQGVRTGYQIWLYHHVEGVGDNVTITFVDRTGTRDYRLAPGNGR